jgi:hypothetical protein
MGNLPSRWSGKQLGLQCGARRERKRPRIWIKGRDGLPFSFYQSGLTELNLLILVRRSQLLVDFEFGLSVC